MAVFYMLECVLKKTRQNQAEGQVIQLKSPMAQMLGLVSE